MPERSLVEFMSLSRQVILVKGIVQGVGFRPFVYQLAGRYGLKGQVINTPEGVVIDVEGKTESIDKFSIGLKEEAPPLARIEGISSQPMEPTGCPDFKIGYSERAGTVEALVSTDVSICPDCLRELFDPTDRRYRYPFINCTNCGPRFTIIKDVPYDREYTTMNVFRLCPECQAEYDDPADRRFHAQPNACPVCGPKVVLRDSAGGLVAPENAVIRAAALLKEKNILAVKGLGGYHLACNALDDEAVGGLRGRKHREDKPFAVMVRNLEQAAEYCHLSSEEARLLASPARPIVLLKKKECLLADQIAPGNAFIGLMLPYTPLHYLLFEHIDIPLVMTSGNLSDEPIAYEDPDAYMRLGEIADYFLVHNREINHRCDDSVTRVYRDEEYLVRRSRGYSPAPLSLPREMGQVLAVGGEQKNTFCLTKGRHAFISHHIGDLENLETLQAFEREVGMYKKLFHIEPELVAYDYHPEYLSTKYALCLPGIEKTGVQHHHAHIAGCMAEHGLTGHVLGVAFDGTGFGQDGSIWGGEFLYASLTDFQRIGHLNYVPMPGGAQAIREPWRMAAGYLYRQYGKAWRSQKGVKFLSEKNGMVLGTLEEMMAQWINCPPTSSMGRLFDAVAALVGIREQVNYEGQAAVEMEQLALRAGEEVNITYSYVIDEAADVLIIDSDPVISEILSDLAKGDAKAVIAYKFHRTVQDMVIELCLQARARYGENRVCLSGGVFQNMLLLDLVHRGLIRNNFEVFVHRLAPANDGGISLGQAVVANERRKTGCV